MSQDPHRVKELIQSLRQQRDELSMKMHLAGMEAKDEVKRLDAKLSQLCSKYDPVKDAVDETADDVWDAMKDLGKEIGEGFSRIGKALAGRKDN